MSLLPRPGEADRAGLHAVAHDRLHCLDLIVGSGALLAVLAHRVVAHRGMADQRAGIDAELVVEPVHVLREGLPIDVDGAQHLHRDGFDIGQEFGHALFVAAAHRRQRERAVAKDDGGGAVLRREGAQRVPRHLRVVVAVVVDETGRHRQAVGIDGACRRTGDLADFDDLAVLHGKVAAERRHPRTVDDAAITDQQVIRHSCRSPVFMSRPRRPFRLPGACHRRVAGGRPVVDRLSGVASRGDLVVTDRSAGGRGILPLPPSHRTAAAPRRTTARTAPQDRSMRSCR